MSGALLALLLGMALIMSVAWLYQRAVGNGGWIDVFWCFGTGLTCAAAALLPLHAPRAPWRQWLVAALVLVWAARLGSHLTRRVAGGPEDVRYAWLRASWGAHFQRRLLALALVQAPVTMLLGVAVLLAARNPIAQLRTADVAGIAVLLLGIAGEAVADRQLRAFRGAAEPPGAVCERGLWAWSRHPNYFFEFVVWLAYPLLAVRPAVALSWAACSSPLVMFLLLRYVTGVPPLEQAMLRSRGEAYRRYQGRVSAFVPWPPRAAGR